LGEVRERRRLARIPLRCAVVVREKLATTLAETEDIGARGCRIVLKRPAPPGTLLQIRFLPAGATEPLDAVGQVVWSRKTPPLEAGIAFVSAPRAASTPSVGGWMETLVLSKLRQVVAGEVALGALADVQLTACGAPRSVQPDDLAAVRVAKASGTIGEVADLRPLIGLLERGVVCVARVVVDLGGARPLFASDAAPDSRAASAVLVPPPPARPAGEPEPTEE
jgi:hypothetical protein